MMNAKELELKLSDALQREDVLKENISALEARCAALAAENAGLMKFCKDAAFDADYEAELCMERGGFTDALNDIKTPATDAFLAEVRASGVEMFATKTAEDLRTAGGAWGVIQEPYHEVADYLEDRGESFAAKIRKGAQS